MGGPRIERGPRRVSIWKQRGDTGLQKEGRRLDHHCCPSFGSRAVVQRAGNSLPYLQTCSPSMPGPWGGCGRLRTSPQAPRTAPAWCLPPPALSNTGTATVVLGAYNLRRRERSRQNFSIKSISENGYDPQENLNDVLLLQVGRGVGGLTMAWGAQEGRATCTEPVVQSYSQVHSPFRYPLDPGHGSWANLPSHQQNLKVPVSLHHYRHCVI